jgi:competence protein ComGC
MVSTNQMRPSRTRSALTVIEVLVIIIVVLILAGLLLPADRKLPILTTYDLRATHL